MQQHGMCVEIVVVLFRKAIFIALLRLGKVMLEI
jgi:hypothetical protein